jgi:hypothetical protein
MVSLLPLHEQKQGYRCSVVLLGIEAGGFF